MKAHAHTPRSLADVGEIRSSGRRVTRQRASESDFRLSDAELTFYGLCGACGS